MAGKIYVTGIGPGAEEKMTEEAKAVIERADAVVGYTVYVDLVKDLCEGKEIRSTGMMKEVERCRIALDLAKSGKDVAFVCSGDPGVYGMAGVMMEVAGDDPDIEIKVIAGVSACCSGAAVLGAPLVSDFAVISLSDILTPMSLIEKRLDSAAEADFVICIYNPKSRKRAEHLDRAVRIISKHRSEDTPCGYVKNIGREREKAVVCTLADLAGNDDIDMFTTVFIGNGSTKVINGKLVTSRGYKGI